MAAASRDHRADLMLLLVTVCWGVSFSAIKTATDHASPALFVGVRFALASLLMLAGWPLLLRGEEPRFRARGYRMLADPAVVRWGLLLGLLTVTGYLTQTIGLTTTTADNSAFITSLSVVLVPVVVYLVHRTRPAPVVGAGVVVATAGLLLMTRPDLGRVVAGDVWTLGTAVAYAFYLERLSAALKRVAYLPLLWWTLAVCSAFSLLVAAIQGGAVWDWNRELATALIVTTLFSTLLALYLQNRFQGRTTATRAALIFSAEPVFAAVFAWGVLDERLGASGLAGAALILGAVAAVELIKAPVASGSTTGTGRDA